MQEQSRTGIIKSAQERQLEIEKKLKEIESLTNEFKGYSFEQKLALYQEAFEPLKRKVVQMLIRNYNSSGIKTKTGTLLNNIKKARIDIFFANKKEDTPPQISVKLPKESDISKYKGKDVKKSYIVANALDAGAVHGASESSFANKSKIKKKAKKKNGGVELIGGVQIDLSTATKKGRRTTADSKTTSGAGKLTIISEFDYFQLSKSQLRSISSMLIKNVESML